MAKISVWVHCPYCGLHQPVVSQFEIRKSDEWIDTRANILVRCEHEKVGCDGLFAVTATLEINATVYKLVEPGA